MINGNDPTSVGSFPFVNAGIDRMCSGLNDGVPVLPDAGVFLLSYNDAERFVVNHAHMLLNEENDPRHMIMKRIGVYMPADKQ